uniref:U21-Liphistoxin-Lth1a_1 n=1 Tax=Liphistius thaleban TaxID=1905330 RepID=A0A4Q8K6S1_9ARAC
MAALTLLQFSLTIILLAGLPGTHCRRRRYRDCSEERLTVREDAADVVLTGTVKRLYGGHDPVYSGEVQVKRVLKGDNIRVGESLLVEGFGSNVICYSKVRVKDSKIFLLGQLHTGRFRLNSSLLEMNVPNLDRIAAAVKNIPYRRRPTIQDEPCEKKYCPFNGDCYEDRQKAQCRCPTACQHQYEPVCASDGLTYNSECQMRADSCRKQRRMFVRYEGVCLRSEI